MSIGEALEGYLGDRQRKTIGLTWGEAWVKRGGKEYKTSHLISSVSRVMNNDPVGIRFFFHTPEKAGLLFDVLGVGRDDRRRLTLMAEEHLVPMHEQPAKLLVNITPWPSTRDEVDQMFRAVESVMLREHDLFPAVVVLTKEQYRALPRTFDDWKDRVRVCRVSSEDADAIIEDESGSGGLVLSPTPFSDFSRWAAIVIKGGTLVMEPPDALEAFRKGGALAPLPRVEAPLSDDLVSETAGLQPELPDDPLRLRRLMWDLSTEQGARDLGWSAGDRLALGRRLGISVASTESERLDAKLKALERKIADHGVSGVASCSAEELASVLLRAKTRATGPTVLRVGGSLHLINVPTEVANLFADDPAVKAHAVAAPSSPLARMLDELKTWVSEDYLRDPFLESVMSSVVAHGEDGRLAAHARTSLLRRGAKPICRQGDAVSDPLVVLGSLVGLTLPPVMARILPTPSTGGFVAVMEKARAQLESDEPWLVGRPPWQDDFVVTEADRIVRVHLEEWQGDEQSRRLSYGHEIRKARPLHFPPDNWAPSDEETWLSMAEHSPALSMAPVEPDFDRVAGSSSSRGPVRARASGDRATIGWEAIRTQAAQIWLAIHRAVAGGNTVSVGPGHVLLDVAAGVSASVSLCAWPRGTGKPLEVRVPATISETNGGGAEVLSVATAEFETGSRVESYREVRRLPVGLELSGDGVVVTVRLTVNRVTTGGLGANGLAAVAADDD